MPDTCGLSKRKWILKQNLRNIQAHTQRNRLWIEIQKKKKTRNMKDIISKWWIYIFMTFRDLLNLLSRSCFPVKMLDENIHAAICLIHLQFPVFKLVQHSIILGFNLWIILVLAEFKLFIEQFLVFTCFFLEFYKNIFDLRTIASLLSPWTASTIAVSQ